MVTNERITLAEDQSREILKIISLTVFIGLFLQSCSTSVQITSRKIHRSSRFDEGFLLYKIMVDSFDHKGKPVKYRADSVFECMHVWDFEFKEIPRYLMYKYKSEYQKLFRVYDSLLHFDELVYRNADTIIYLSTRYIPAGMKRSVQFYELEAKLDFLRYKGVRPKCRKTIFFSRRNNRYKWYSWRHNQRDDKKEITAVKFVTHSWYVIHLDCSYGLLTSGTCTFFFSFNGHRKPIVFREDKIRGGPF